MPRFSFSDIALAGIASAVPTRTIKSEVFSEEFGESTVRKFVEMTGVREYRVCSEYQTASDLGYIAAERLLSEKKIDRASIGVLVFGGHCPDYTKPATAAVLHKRLELDHDCACFDVGLGCSAFVYCAQIACSMLMCSDKQRALIIVGETGSKLVNPKDRSLEMLVGEGSSAILLEKSTSCDRITGELCTDGDGYRAIIVPAGGFRNRYDTHETMIWEDGNPRTLYNTNMNGMDVFTFTMTKIPKTIKAFLKANNRSVETYDCFAFHQANLLILKQLAKKMKIDLEKMPVCLDRYGNTGASSIPMTLSDRYGADTTARDIDVLMCGFGVGLSWGMLSMKMNTADILPIMETDDYFSEGIIHSPKDLQ